MSDEPPGDKDARRGLPRPPHLRAVPDAEAGAEPPATTDPATGLPPAQPWHGEQPPHAIDPGVPAPWPVEQQPAPPEQPPTPIEPVAGQPWPGTTAPDAALRSPWGDVPAATGGEPAPTSGEPPPGGDAATHQPWPDPVPGRDPFAAFAQGQATGADASAPVVPDGFGEHAAVHPAPTTSSYGVRLTDRVRLVVRDNLGAAALAGLIVWLAFHFGGYHPRHWTIAAVLLAAAAAALAVRGPVPARRTPAAVALLLGAALTAWAAASITWATASRHLAWDETARMLLYLAALAVGALAFGRREQATRLAGWLGVAIGATMLVEAARFAGGSSAARAFVAGRLDAPLGYSNATAAFCMVGAWLLVGASLGLTRRLRLRIDAASAAGTTWQFEQRLHATGMLAAPGEVRVPPLVLAWTSVQAGLALGGAGGLVACAWLAQSRGALLAAVVAVVVAFVVVPGRAALLARLVLVAGVVVAMRDALDAPYTTLTVVANAVTSGDAKLAAPAHVASLRASALSAVHHAGTTIVLIAVVTALVGAVVAWVGELLARTPAARPSRTVSSVVAIVGVLAIASGVAVATAAGHSPFGYAKDQVSACRDAARSATPPADVAAAATSHFRSIGTNRCDFWRVALLDAREHPVVGVGANNFGATYVAHRHSTEEPRQAHSLPLDLLAGLGIVGGALALLLLTSIGVGVVAFVRSGVQRDPATCALVVVAAGWLVHASVDWLWNMPAASLPVWLGLGALAGCASRNAIPKRRSNAPGWGVDGIDRAPTLGGVSGAGTPVAAWTGASSAGAMATNGGSTASIDGTAGARQPWGDVTPVRSKAARSAALRRLPLALGVLVIVIATVVPQGIADQQLRAAQGQPATDAGRARAIRQAERAASADPTWAAPLGFAGELRVARGDDARALIDLRGAVQREPHSWAIRAQSAAVAAKVVRRVSAALANRSPAPNGDIVRRLRALRRSATGRVARDLRAARRLNPQLAAATARARAHSRRSDAAS